MKDYTALTLEHEAEFERIFGVELRRFMRSVLGFDILRFDDTVIKPEANPLRKQSNAGMANEPSS